MATYMDSSVFCSPFGEVLPLDSLRKRQLISNDPGPREFDICDPAADVEAAIERRETVVALARFLKGLSPRDQMIVRRLFWTSESQAEVARSLHVSRMAICKALRKILERGREELADFSCGSLAA